MHGIQASPSLLALRNKTDRQLIVLASREIERSLNLASHGSFSEAETRYAKARTLLEIARAPDRERREIEARLGLAHAAIERARSAPARFTQSACC
jgi:hypothetical protein